MPDFPRRTEYSFWHNHEPSDDIHEMLELLNTQSSTHEPIHLEHCREDGFEWQVVVPWYTEGSSGGDRSGHDYYQIEPTLARQLVEQGFVEKRQLLHPGYTETRDDEFVISDHGKENLALFYSDMRKIAEGMLTPGVHTDLTGNPACRGHRREHWRYGAFYYEFEMPTGGNCRVYPQRNQIVLPEQSAEAA